MTPVVDSAVEALAVQVVRGLAIDAVEKAKSGHPGMPMGCAPMAVSLWTRHLRFDPTAPNWINRDRFILSAGHGSMLLYGLLHLTGYDLPMEELQNFRQWGSRTPGHPENHLTPGVEMATGPLGQGFSTAVGMAIAEAYLNDRYHGLVDHFTYVLASDGDLMEGVVHEAASLAGHLGLGKLVVLYDDNNITIDGRADEAWSDDTASRFAALGWHIQRIDGMDMNAVDEAVIAAKAETGKPSLIICKTIIGFGAPNKADTSGSHGSPLGAEETKLTKENYGLPQDAFFVPDSVRAWFGEAANRGRETHQAWRGRLDAFVAENPVLGAEFQALLGGDLASPLALPAFTEAMATRAANSPGINAAAAAHPGLIGGCADLTDNVQTRIKGSPLFQRDQRAGRNIAFGVREHAMAAAANGITLHGATRGFAGTFLIFSDYCRPSIRLAALMECPTIFCFSHDSIGLGEDGPTHQPIEQVMSLRTIPNLNVMRPADGNEVSAAWHLAMVSKSTPSVIVTTRQNLPVSTPAFDASHPALRGGYVLAEASGAPKLVIVATGSEVQHALAARSELEKEGIPTRVVSLMSWFVFESQPAEYRASILPKDVPTLSVEAGTTLGWNRYADACVGIDRFGASAPGPVLMEKFGFTTANVLAQSKKLLE